MTPQNEGAVTAQSNERRALLIGASARLGPVRTPVGTSFLLGYSFEGQHMPDRDETLNGASTASARDLSSGMMATGDHILGLGVSNHWFSPLGIGIDHQTMLRYTTPHEAPASDVLRLRERSGTSYQTLPWVSWDWGSAQTTTAYVLLAKNLDRLDDGNSYQSYGTSRPSFGVTHALRLFNERLHLKANVVRFNYIYNDYFLDHSHTGADFGAEMRLSQGFVVGGAAGRYIDSYNLDVPKVGGCSPGERQGTTPVRCRRLEDITTVRINAQWLPAFIGVSYSLLMAENRSLNEYDKAKQVLMVYTQASFPSTRPWQPVDRTVPSFLSSE